MIKPKLLFFINHLSGSGGAQKAALEVCNHLSALGYAVELVPLAPTVNRPAGLSNEVGLHALWSPPLSTRGRMMRRLTTLIRRGQIRRLARKAKEPTVVISFTTGANLPVLRAIGRSGISVIVSERNAMPRPGCSGDWHARVNTLYKDAALITSNSRAVLHYFECQGLPQTYHTPNPYRLPQYNKEAESLKGDVKTILVVGGLREQKGYDLIFRAIAQAKLDQHPDLRLKIIGEGSLKPDLMSLAEKLAIHDRLDWIGVVDDLAPHYLSADLFILASRWEGVPNVLLEALGYGLPCVVSRIPGVTEYVEDNVHAIAFQSENHTDLSEKIRLLLDSPELRRRLSRNARLLAETFSKTNKIDVWMQAIERVMATSERARGC